ncbi:MAG: VRR-NUC domain-containing protein [Candidatus Paceibacteria bacterium]
MTEETILKNQIKDYLNIKQVFWWYNLQGLGSQKGIPDLFALKNGVLFAIEVKSPKGKLSEAQENFLERIKLNGGTVIIARKLEDIEKFL